MRVVEVTTPLDRPPSPRKYIEAVFKEWKDEDSKEKKPETGEECCERL